MYFLDTNTCIYFLSGRSQNIKEKILSTAPIEIAIPVVVKAELVLGAYKSRYQDPTLKRIDAFLAPFEIVPFDDQLVPTYAEIRSSLEESGRVIGPNDLLIAAIAQFHDAILVTNNLAEFSRIESLKTENWYDSLSESKGAFHS